MTPNQYAAEYQGKPVYRRQYTLQDDKHNKYYRFLVHEVKGKAYPHYVIINHYGRIGSRGIYIKHSKWFYSVESAKKFINDTLGPERVRRGYTKVHHLLKVHSESKKKKRSLKKSSNTITAWGNDNWDVL